MPALMLRYLPHLIAAAVLFAAGAWVGAQSAGKRAARAELALSHYQRDAAQQVAMAAESARAEERRRTESVAEAAEQAERANAEAKERADRTVADLRAGNLRLRQHWQAAVATCELSADSAAARHAEEIAQLRAEDIGRVRGIAAEADAQVKGLQEAYEALRRPAP